MTPSEAAAVEARLGNEQALALSPDGGGVAGAVASTDPPATNVVASAASSAAAGAVEAGVAEAA